MKMNAVTKLADKFRSWMGFIKQPAQENVETPKSRNIAVYSESGWVAEVEIVADDSDANEYRYTLRVLKTLKTGLLGSLHDGHIFNVFAVKEYAVYCGWRLSTVNF